MRLRDEVRATPGEGAAEGRQAAGLMHEGTCEQTIPIHAIGGEPIGGLFGDDDRAAVGTEQHLSRVGTATLTQRCGRSLDRSELTRRSQVETGDIARPAVVQDKNQILVNRDGVRRIPAGVLNVDQRKPAAGGTRKTEMLSLPTLATSSHWLSALNVMGPWEPRRGSPDPRPPVSKRPISVSEPSLPRANETTSLRAAALVIVKTAPGANSSGVMGPSLSQAAGRRDAMAMKTMRFSIGSPLSMFRALARSRARGLKDKRR